MKPKRRYTEDEISLMAGAGKELYGAARRWELAARLERTPAAIYAAAHRMGIIGNVRLRNVVSNRKPNLRVLRDRICPKCGTVLGMQSIEDGYGFRLWDIYGHSFYYENEDLITMEEKEKDASGEKVDSTNVGADENKKGGLEHGDNESTISGTVS